METHQLSGIFDNRVKHGHAGSELGLQVAQHKQRLFDVQEAQFSKLACHFAAWMAKIE